MLEATLVNGAAVELKIAAREPRRVLVGRPRALALASGEGLSAPQAAGRLIVAKKRSCAGQVGAGAGMLTPMPLSLSASTFAVGTSKRLRSDWRMVAL
jgi:hypothetical protein